MLMARHHTEEFMLIINLSHEFLSKIEIKQD